MSGRNEAIQGCVLKILLWRDRLSDLLVPISPEKSIWPRKRKVGAIPLAPQDPTFGCRHKRLNQAKQNLEVHLLNSLRFREKWGLGAPLISISKILNKSQGSPILLSKIKGARLSPQFFLHHMIPMGHRNTSVKVFLAYNFILFDPFWVKCEQQQ